ncbi:MAG: hypothetical protein ABL962_20950 [Fimbriimonadaceae bacterium]
MKIPPIKKYCLGDRIHIQAQQVWIVLVSWTFAARKLKKKTLTYGDLAELMGYSRRAGITLGRALGIVGTHCKNNNLPTLNSIVVNEVTGKPGDHVVVRKGYTPEREQAEVIKEAWFLIRVPTTGTFRKVWEEMGDQ